jgi:hypothetical protein
MNKITEFTTEEMNRVGGGLTNWWTGFLEVGLFAAGSTELSIIAYSDTRSITNE